MAVDGQETPNLVGVSSSVPTAQDNQFAVAEEPLPRDPGRFGQDPAPDSGKVEHTANGDGVERPLWVRGANSCGLSGEEVLARAKTNSQRTTIHERVAPG